MLSRLRSKLTYANVVTSLALFLALGGVAYAATNLPKNSVGPKQLQANAVSSEKVKDGSLKATDVTAGVIAAGGGAPVKGEQGAKGEKGDKGDPLDFGFLTNAHDLPGFSVAAISIDGHPFADFKAYRIDCTTAQLCTVTIGGSTSGYTEYKAWYEQAQQGDPNATKSFSITEYTNHESNPVARYHVTKGRPSTMQTMNDRYELTFTTEFVQRVSV